MSERSAVALNNLQLSFVLTDHSMISCFHSPKPYHVQHHISLVSLFSTAIVITVGYTNFNNFIGFWISGAFALIWPYFPRV